MIRFLQQTNVDKLLCDGYKQLKKRGTSMTAGNRHQSLSNMQSDPTQGTADLANSHLVCFMITKKRYLLSLYEYACTNINFSIMIITLS